MTTPSPHPEPDGTPHIKQQAAQKADLREQTMPAVPVPANQKVEQTLDTGTQTTPEARPQLIDDTFSQMVDEYCERRSTIIFSPRFDCTDLQKLDEQFAGQLDGYREHFIQNPGLLKEARAYTHVENLGHLVTAMEERYHDLGYQIGLARGRVEMQDSINGIHFQRDDLKDFLVDRLRPEHFIDRGLQRPPEELELFRRYVEDTMQVTFAKGELEGIKVRLIAEARADKLYKVIGGLKAYPPMSYLASVSMAEEIVQPLSREELKHLDEAYFERYGRHLREAFKKTFRGENRLTMYHYLRDNDIAAAAERVCRILNSWHFKSTRGALIRKIYQDYNSEQIQKIEEKANALLEKRCDTTLSELMDKRLRPGDVHSIAWLARDRSVESDVALLHQAMESSGFLHARDAVRHYFRDITEEDLQILEEAYLREHDISIMDHARERLSQGPVRDLVIASLERDDQQRSAALVACSLAFKEDWIGALFLNTPEDERIKLIDDYNGVYHKGEPEGFWRDLRHAVLRDDFSILRHIPGLNRFCERNSFPFCNSFPFIHSIIETGDLTEAETIRYFMEGIGADGDGIRLVLKDRTKEEIAAIEEDYNERYGPNDFIRTVNKIPILRNFYYNGNFRDDLRTELSGDDYFDVVQALEGRPETPEQRYRQLQERLVHESGGILLKSLRLGVLSADLSVQKRMEEDGQAALEFYEKKLKDNPAPTRDELLRFETLARYADISFNAHRSTKLAVGEFISNSCAFVGASLGTIPFFLTNAPYTLLVAGAAAGSLMMRVLIRTQVTGAAYSREEKFWDGVRAVVDGLSLWTLRLGALTLGHFISQSMSKSIMKSGFKSSLHQTISQVKDRVLRQRKAHHLLDVESAVLPTAPLEPMQQLREAKSQMPDFLKQHDMNAGIENAFRRMAHEVASIKMKTSLLHREDSGPHPMQ